METNEALAIAFTNLRGSKDKDLLGTARALAYLKSLPQYRSNKRVGEAVGVSSEIVRQFLTLTTFPEPVQDLFGERKLGLEHGRLLWQLRRSRPEAFEDAVEAFTGLPSHDARAVLDYLLRHRNASVAAAVEAVRLGRGSKEREFHVVAILPEDRYQDLRREATRRRASVDRLVTEVVTNWLDGVADAGR